MAGLITHFLVCDKSFRSSKIDSKLRKILRGFSDWVRLGAASPDLPYAVLIGSQKEWADHMHYENTNGIIIRGHEELRNGITTDTEKAKLAWLFGYISHVLVDATIHPIIEALVGPYSIEANREPHQYSEKTQDSLLFTEVMKGLELTYAEYSDSFDNCKSAHYFSDVMAFWKHLVDTTYPGKEPEADPESWFKTFRLLFDEADNKGGLAMISRHVAHGWSRSKVYRKASDLRQNFQDDCDKYYDNIKLPYGRTGSFFVDGFQKSIANVIETWNTLWFGLSNPLAVAELIPNWNLDTGRVIGALDDDITLWRA